MIVSRSSLLVVPFVMAMAACSLLDKPLNNANTTMQTGACDGCDTFLVPNDVNELSPEHRTVFRKLYDHTSDYTSYENRMLNQRLATAATDKSSHVLHIQTGLNTSVPLNPYRLVVFCPNNKIVTESGYSPEYNVKNKINFKERCAAR